MARFTDIDDVYRKTINEETLGTVEKPDVKMKLSPALSAELTATLNSLTALCAKFVKKSYANDELAKKMEKKVDKLKNLLKAAKNI